MIVGVIAGSGGFPATLISYCQGKGHGVVVARVKEHCELDDSSLYPNLEFPIGQLKRVARFFARNRVSHVVFLGGINRSKINFQIGKSSLFKLSSYLRLWRTIRPDCELLKIIRRVGLKDDVILRAFANFFELRGFQVVGATEIMEDLIVRQGVHGAIFDITPQVEQDIDLGWRAAENIGSLDIGQSVVVSNGIVIAVEAAEGTDAMIKRAGELLHSQTGVLVKLPKPHQDLRLDLPAVGIETLKNMAAHSLKILVLKDQGAMVLDPNFYQVAQDLGVMVIVR